MVRRDAKIPSNAVRPSERRQTDLVAIQKVALWADAGDTGKHWDKLDWSWE
jgi:hypothetical protein